MDLGGPSRLGIFKVWMNWVVCRSGCSRPKNMLSKNRHWAAGVRPTKRSASKGPASGGPGPGPGHRTQGWQHLLQERCRWSGPTAVKRLRVNRARYISIQRWRRTVKLECKEARWSCRLSSCASAIKRAPDNARSLCGSLLMRLRAGAREISAVLATSFGDVREFSHTGASLSIAKKRAPIRSELGMPVDGPRRRDLVCWHSSCWLGLTKGRSNVSFSSSSLVITGKACAQKHGLHSMHHPREPARECRRYVNSSQDLPGLMKSRVGDGHELLRTDVPS